VHHNGLKTAVLLAGLAGFVMLIGYFFFGTTGLLIGFLISLAINGYAYFNSAKMALRSMHAYPVTAEQQPGLYRIVHELAQAQGQPMPALYVSPTQAPNAFATGRNPEHAAVCATQGILDLLDERELRGVLGHELAHVYNRDILIASVAATLATVITMLANLAYFIPLGGDDDRPNPIALLALASALRKLEAGVQAAPLPPEPNLQTTSAMMIANPFRAGDVKSWFSTHPPMAERIARLEAMAYGGYRPDKT
jgi:heat shock protein HtpX